MIKDGKIYVTWKMVKEYIDHLCDRLLEEDVLKNCSGIYTFPRGGLILATLLSYRTGLPILTNPANNCIIIDDIVDTGVTMVKYSNERMKNNYYITSMYVHEDQLSETADYNCIIDYFEYVKRNDWIVYPWEEMKEW